MGIDISVKLGGFDLRTPLVTASGTYGYGDEYKDLVDFNALGAITVKGVTLHEKKGNPPARVVETPMGMLNAVGLQNEGVDYFLKEKAPRFKELNTPVIANLSASCAEDFLKLTEKINETDTVCALEINVSCPNLSKGGMSYGKDPKAVYSLVSEIKKISKFPIITKLTPNVTDITEIARAAEDAGSDNLCLINTLLGMAIDINTRKPVLANKTGGLSGPAIKPVALAMVWQVCNAVKIPVIGMGGVMDANDALEFLIAGASAVGIGTVNFIDPKAPEKIIAGIKEYMENNNYTSISQIKGSLKYD